MTQDYVVPKHTVNVETEVKKSRFIAWARRAEDRTQAMAFLDQLKAQYPDARHHCWAYLIGDPLNPTTVAMSDDGEPSGTAGKPILNVLQHKNIGDIMLVVVRYFGGIKLGAGGLVRAYSAAAQAAISLLETDTKVFLIERKVIGNFALEQILRHWLQLHGGEIRDVRYSAVNGTSTENGASTVHNTSSADSAVTLHIALRSADVESLTAFTLAHGATLLES